MTYYVITIWASFIVRVFDAVDFMSDDLVSTFMEQMCEID